MTGKLKKFLEFCYQFDLIMKTQSNHTLPRITPTIMTYYAAWLYEGKHVSTYQSLNSYLSAVNSWCKAHSRPNPTTDVDTNTVDYGYDSIKKAIHKRMGEPIVQRMPITMYHLTTLSNTARTLKMLTIQQAINYDAMILLAWYGLLRVGEFTAPSTKSTDTRIPASRDIQFHPTISKPTHFSYLVKSSKTDQVGKGALIRIFANNGPQCPVRAMTTLLTTYPREPNQPLFTLHTEANQQPATRQQFTSITNQLFKQAGINDATLKPHSFRQGGASAAIQFAHQWQVQAMGRWKSDAWRDYTFIDNRMLEHTHMAMSKAPKVPGNAVGRTVTIDPHNV